MSRSVSAPSSVTKPSPCWNGLIVPGSTLRYGSNFWSWTRRPRAFSNRPSEAATIPLPSAETTPPVTKTYFGARALTGFQGSSACGRSLGGVGGSDSHCFVGTSSICDRRTEERAEPRQRLGGVRPTDAGEPRHLYGEGRDRLVVFIRHEVELDIDAVGQELEDDAGARDHVDHEQFPCKLRLPAEGRLGLPSLDPPEPAGHEPPATRVDRVDSSPPAREPV